MARILVAKPGLDGHDRGAKLIARALRDAGHEVIYTGIRQRASVIVSAAVDEDVDVVGLSILSGSHLALARAVVEGLRQAGADDILVTVGGTIPRSDIDELTAMGCAAVFPTGTTLDHAVAAVDDLTQPGAATASRDGAFAVEPR